MNVLLAVLTGTTAHVGISLHGVSKSGSRHLQGGGAFQRGGLDQFHVETDENLGEVWKIHIWHDNTGFKTYLSPRRYTEKSDLVNKKTSFLKMRWNGHDFASKCASLSTTYI